MTVQVTQKIPNLISRNADMETIVWLLHSQENIVTEEVCMFPKGFIVKKTLDQLRSFNMFSSIFLYFYLALFGPSLLSQSWPSFLIHILCPSTSHTPLKSTCSSRANHKLRSQNPEGNHHQF